VQRFRVLTVYLVYLKVMPSISFWKHLFTCVVLLQFITIAQGQNINTNTADHASYQKVLDKVLVQDQRFRQNQGQWEKDILYQTSGNGAAAAFYSDKVIFSLVKNFRIGEDTNNLMEARASYLNWSLSFDESTTSQVFGKEQVENSISYFGINDQNGSSLDEFSELHYKNVYPNTDLIFYGNDKGSLKYDFVVKPGGEVDAIKMNYDGIEDVILRSDGKLQLTTAWGEFLEDKPYSYQIVNGKEVEVDVRYNVSNRGVGFEVFGEYDSTIDLIIDPIYVDWSTYFYGDPITSTWGWNYVLDVDIDDEDYVYITGMSSNQRFYSQLGGYDTSVNGGYDAFVCKITPKGDSLKYFTYLGGSSYEYGMNVSVNSKHEVVVSGITYGGGFPTTSGAFDENGKSCSGGWCYQGFVTKLNMSGDSLIYSTYLTGTRTSGTYSIDWIRGMQVTDNGKVYLVGNTSSEDFPVTSNCYQPTYGGTSSTGYYYWHQGDGFLTCLNSDGSGLVFSTYIGGAGIDVAKDVYVDGSGFIYVVGQTSSGNFRTTPGASVFNKYIKGNTDGFVIKFKANGNQVEWAKLMGGSGDDYFESIYATETGDPFIVGATTSTNFPTTAKAFQQSHSGGYDAVVVKMISAGTNVYYSTYLGGGSDDGFSWNYPFFSPLSITANVRDEAIVAATSRSQNFPTTSDAIQPKSKLTTGGFYGSLTISKLDFTGSKQLYGTYYGGSRGEFPGGVKAKRVGCVTYILSAGNSFSGDYPTTKGVYKDSLRATGSFWTGFVTKFRDTLYTEPIDLGFKDTMVECDNVFEIFDAKNQGADFIWSNGGDNRFNIAKDSGLIWVQATYGCDTVRDSVQILLEHSPKVPVFDNDTTYCDNFPSIQLDAKNDTIIRSYAWHDGDTNQTYTVNQPGKYYVDIITPNCGTKTDTINLKLLDSPDVSLTPDTISCDSVRLVLDAGNANNDIDYRWNTGDSVQQITALDTGFYKVVVTNFCGQDSAETEIVQHLSPTVSLPSDSVFCNTVDYGLKVGQSNNGEIYNWDDIVNLVGIGSADSLTIKSSVYARVTIQNSCGTALDSMLIGLLTTPTGAPKDTIHECDVVDEILRISSAKTNNDEQYTWSIAGESDSSYRATSPGEYIAYLSNKCGADSVAWTIILKETPQVDLPADTTYCDDIKTFFDVTNSDPEMVYKWQDDSQLPMLAVSGPGRYSVKLTNRCGSDSDHVVLSLLHQPTVTLNQDQIFCGQVSPTMYTIGRTGNDETYTWSDGSNDSTATFLTEGNHWVVVSNKCGDANDTVNFRISPYPIVDLGLDTILCGKFSLELDAGNSGMSYNWLPDGETSQKINATKQQLYSVIVTNADGCESGDDFEVGSGCISYYHVPTGFSPNGDGLNEVFKPTLVNYQDFTMSIYNRWGEELFVTNDPNIGWDGTYQGAVVQNGIYLYKIRFITTEDGGFKTVEGLVHVVR
jgi:gliding motility-associated-like protein